MNIRFTVGLILFDLTFVFISITTITFVVSASNVPIGRPSVNKQYNTDYSTNIVKMKETINNACCKKLGESMKIIKFTADGNKKTGLMEGVEIIELSCTFIEALDSSNIKRVKTDKIYSIDDIKINSPVFPSKIVCIGLNYKDHAAELKMDLPDEPVIFLKPPTAVIGPLDTIIYPDSSNQVDYEAELGIVISKEAKNVSENDAEEYIGGYTIFNDVTARDLQRKDIQWTRAKSFDTFAPIGPCIETELDTNNLDISLKLNQDVKQKSNTKNMIFDVYELVEFVSNIMTLYSGDVIATGTPPGVGPMEIGDTVEVEIEGIGKLINFIK